ncbi:MULTISPECIES: hypothetical protein [unclassified Microbacterium]|uniref:hypothetical protein n=1 Tax=unclassified Microbacterium TaxID=2609290 RepID=UPI0030160515
MAKYLLLGAASSPWRLHVTEDPTDLLHRINTACDLGERTYARVVSNDQLDAINLDINPRALGWWTILDHGGEDA